MIDTFTKKEFENYLEANHVSYISLGLVDDEECYNITLDNQVSIIVRSSVKSNGLSADVASDSIRAWLMGRDKPLGAKTRTHRQPGWQDRLNSNIKQLVLWRALAGDCKECNKPKGIFKAKTVKNRGRPFARCKEHKDSFVWLDKPIEKSDIYFSEESRELSSSDRKEDKKAKSIQQDKITKKELAKKIKTKKGCDLTQQSIIGESHDTSKISQEAKETMAYSKRDEQDTSPMSSKQDTSKFLEHTLPKQQSSNLPRLPKGPNEAQQVAIEFDTNIDLRVLAGPGSGKTFVIARRCKFLIGNGIHPDKILVCTFGKNASIEMGQRIQKLVSQANLEQICTINALCYRLLAKWYPDSRWYKWQGPKDWEIKKCLEDAVSLVWQEKEKPNSQEVFQRINSSKYHSLTVDDSYEYFISQLGQNHGEWLYEIRSKFDAWLNRNRFLTFADQLYLVEKRLQSDSQWRDMLQAKFSHVIIDEGQDCNFQAMRILITLSLEPSENTVYEEVI